MKLDVLRSPRVSTAIWVFASYGFAIGSLIAIQVILTRTQAVSLVGHLAVAIAITSIFESTITSRGAETALTLIAQRSMVSKEEPAGLLLELLVVDGVWYAAATVLFIAGALLADLAGVADASLLIPLALAVTVQFAWSTCKSLQTVYSRIDRQSQTELLSNVVGFTLQGVATAIWGVYGYCWGAVASGLWKTAIAMWILIPKLRHLSWPPRLFSESPLREYLRLGGFGVVRSFATYFAAQIDILLLAVSAGPQAVAHYRIARSVANTPARALTPIWTLARKVILGGMHHDTIGEARKRILLIAGGFLVLGVPVVVALALLGPALLTAVFGAPYAAAAPALTILFAGNWFLSVCTGWAKFAASIAPKKAVTTFAFISQSVVCAVLWQVLKPHDAAGMAIIAAASGTVTALTFWGALYQQHWLVGRGEASPRAVDTGV